MRTGGCQCGKVGYESAVEPLALYVCHCRECQKQSASGFGMSLVVPRAGLRLTRGAPKYWTRATDSGRRLKCAFCPNCGSRLWHEPEGAADTITIKADRWTTPSISPPQFTSGPHENCRGWLYRIVPSSFRKSPTDRRNALLVRLRSRHASLRSARVSAVAVSNSFSLGSEGRRQGVRRVSGASLCPGPVDFLEAARAFSR